MFEIFLVLGDSGKWVGAKACNVAGEGQRMTSDQGAVGIYINVAAGVCDHPAAFIGLLLARPCK